MAENYRMGIAVDLFEEMWQLAYRRASQPLTDLSLPGDAVGELLEGVFLKIIDETPELPPRVELSASVLEKAKKAALRWVADERHRTGDPDLYRVTTGKNHPGNINLKALQQRGADGHFSAPEWDKLPRVLEPLGFSILQRKGVPTEDAKDLFSESLAGLVRGRGSDGKAPIELVTVFEELAPLFGTMVSHRVVDWSRKMKSLKNQPNVQHSLDELTDNPNRPLQVADPKTTRGKQPGDLSFEDIYYQCHECLDEFEWRLIYEIYVGQDMTRGDMIEDGSVLSAMGIKPSASPAKKRRHLKAHIESALANLAKCLQQ